MRRVVGWWLGVASGCSWTLQKGCGFESSWQDALTEWWLPVDVRQAGTSVMPPARVNSIVPSLQEFELIWLWV